MEIAIILIAFVGAFIAFYSGFGLGTVLLPAMLLVLPAPTAILCTAIVHFGNNIFKFALIYRHVAWKSALIFGILSGIGAWLGAILISFIGKVGQLFTLEIGNFNIAPTATQLLIGIIIIAFAFIEKFKLKLFEIPPFMLYAGGIISGFFGGLSGHQGALRTLFLKPLIANKEIFIATGSTIALAVDITRLSIYTSNSNNTISIPYILMIGASLAAFAGTALGKYFLPNISLKRLDTIIFICLLVMGISLCLGLV